MNAEILWWQFTPAHRHYRLVSDGVVLLRADAYAVEEHGPAEDVLRQAAAGLDLVVTGVYESLDPLDY